MHDDYDRSSKWIIEHYGNSLLRLGGVSGIRSWRALANDVVQPRQLPDGLLEVIRADDETPDYYIVEIATYPEARVAEQVLRDAMLVLLDRRVLSEVLTVVLRPKGRARVSGTSKQRSRREWTHLQLRWKVIEMWKVRASDILAADDLGAIPWVPLTQFDETPRAILEQCRAKIERLAPPEQQANFLAVTQVMTHLRYNHQHDLLSILGGVNMISKFPLIEELTQAAAQKAMQEDMHEARRQDLRRFLAARFGALPSDTVTLLDKVDDDARLESLIDWAGRCPDLDSFRTHLTGNGVSSL